MIKFIHKKRSFEEKTKGKIIIYYNISDIFLGLVLMALVLFFVRDYLSHNLGQCNKINYSVNASNPFINGEKINLPIQKL